MSMQAKVNASSKTMGAMLMPLYTKGDMVIYEGRLATVEKYDYYVLNSGELLLVFDDNPGTTVAIPLPEHAEILKVSTSEALAWMFHENKL